MALKPLVFCHQTGLDELISLITMAYLEPGDEVVMSQYAFLVIPQATRIAGGTVVQADDVDMVTNVDNLLAAVTPKTKILFRQSEQPDRNHD